MRKSAILSVLAAMVMLAACGPEEVSSNGNGSGGGNNTPEPVKVTEISVAQDKIDVTSAGGSFTVQVTSNATLSVSVSSDWVRQSGSGYSFTADHNPGYDPRSCTITFSAGGKSKSVTVTQAQQDAIIPGETQYELFYEAQTFTLPVSTNVDLTVAPTVSWIKSQDTRALSQKNFSFSIEENSSKEPREGIIEITSGSLRQSIKVVQLPTTHRPQTKEEWKDSYIITQTIAEQTGSIPELNSKSNGRWDTNTIVDKLLEIKEILYAVPDQSGKNIFIMQRDSSIYPVVLEFEGTDDLESKSYVRYSSVRTRTGSDSGISYNGDSWKKVAPNSNDRKVLILAPFQSSHVNSAGEEEGYFNTDTLRVKKALYELGYDDKHIDCYTDNEVTLARCNGDFFANYDLVIIRTHGGLWYRRYQKDPVTGSFVFDEQGNPVGVEGPYTVISLGETTDLSFLDDYDANTKNEIVQRYIHGSTTGISVGRDWFEFTTHSSFPNTIIIPFSCHSFERWDESVDQEVDSPFRFFRNNGVSAYSGFHGLAYHDSSNETLYTLLELLCKGLSFKEAVNFAENLPSNFDYDCEDDAFLVDPHPYNLNHVVRNNTAVLTWETNNTSGDYSFEIHVGDDVYNTTSKRYVAEVPSGIGHVWYVVANLLVDGEIIASYKSAEDKFDVEGPDTPAIKVTGVKVNPGTVTLEEGMSVELTATITPTDATNQKVIWSSDHPEFATVDQTGVVTAVAPNGSTRVYVTATTEDGNKTARCRIYVKEATGNRVPVSGISFAQSSAEVELGKTLQLTAGISPMNATNRSIQWFSSDPSVVAVSDGLLSGKKLGTVTITAKTIDGGFTASLEVTVVEKVEDPTVHVSRVSLDKGSLNMKVGESATLKATVSPSNATNKGVTWTSSMNAVATVTSDGVVTAKAAGTAIITVRTDDGGKAATCNVIVVYEPEPVGEIKVNGVTISPLSVNLNVGDSHQFSYRLSPENATNQEVSWSSSDPSVASVDSKGLVVGKSEGKANIIVTTSDGGMVSKASVTVSNAIVPVTGVTISPTEMTMNIGETKPYTLTILPENASNMGYILYTDNYDVASYDTDNQTIVARKWGTANVTVSTSDGGYKATCKVTVIKPPMSISVAPSTLSFGDVNVGETSTKSFTISNTGEYEVNVKDIIPGTAFDINASVPFKIGVGKSVSIDVTFHPTDAKSYTEVISFNTDADNYPTLMLTGTGLKTSSAETFEAVDLGLSVKWANMNLGASSSAEVGSSFSWGSTNPNATTNPYYDGDQYVSKYAHDPKGGSFVDYKEYLEGKDDAAHAILGGNWRMPTPQEVKELLDKCSIKSENGKSILTGPNGNSIELIYRVNYDEYDYWTSGRSGYDVGYESGVGTFNGVSFYYDSRWQLRKTLTRDKKLLIRPVQGNRPDFEPQIKIVQSSLDFGTIKIGQTGKATITIKNTGERLLHIFGVDIPENFSIVFTSSDDPNLQLKFNSWRLAPGCSVTGEVTFGPMSQDFGKQITFYTNSVSNRTVSIPITANVIKEPLMDVVDLGTGIGWGTRNLGASSETDFGDYYALGELTPKTSFSLESYRFYDSETESYTKYTTRYASLDRSDDPVAQKLGGRWRLPTGSEGFKNQSITHNVERNGVMGTVIKSVQEGYKGNSLFIPYAGYINSNGEEAVGKYAMLLYAQTGSSADLMSYFGFPSSAYTIPRWCGVQIRPVCDKISDRSHVKNLFWNYYRETYNL